MSWKDYEEYIHKHFVKLYPDAKITHNIKKLGFLSKSQRQIDMLIESQVAGYNLNIVVDCKYFNKKVDVKTVESFISFLHDVKANKGVLITNRGYTKAAKNRAENDSYLDLELKIIDFKDLESFQGFGGIPYRESAGVVLPPLDGWILDGKQRIPYVLATLYPVGLSFEEALLRTEYVHVYITIKNDIHPNLVNLLTYQEGYIREQFPGCKIEYFETTIRDDAVTRLRLITVPECPTLDYTWFIDFENFIFYCSLVTLENAKNKNLKRLEKALKKAVPLTIEIQDIHLDEGFQRM